MKLQSLLVIAFVTLIHSAPLDDDRNAQITRYENDNIGIDGYKFGFDTSNGISRDEEAQLKNIGTDNETLVVRGRIQWVDNGVTYTLTFLADENGYQPEGDHIPK